MVMPGILPAFFICEFLFLFYRDGVIFAKGYVSKG